jgi:hypothetical protein
VTPRQIEDAEQALAMDELVNAAVSAVVVEEFRFPMLEFEAPGIGSVRQ